MSIRFGISVAALCILVVAGCGEKNAVEVTDHRGKAIAAAEIRALPTSKKDSAARTNGQGIGSAGELPRGARWLQISKPGYRTFLAQVPKRWPLKVKLIPLSPQLPGGTKER